MDNYDFYEDDEPPLVRHPISFFSAKLESGLPEEPSSPRLFTGQLEQDEQPLYEWEIMQLWGESEILSCDVFENYTEEAHSQPQDVYPESQCHLTPKEEDASTYMEVEPDPED